MQAKLKRVKESMPRQQMASSLSIAYASTLPRDCGSTQLYRDTRIHFELTEDLKLFLARLRKENDVRADMLNPTTYKQYHKQFKEHMKSLGLILPNAPIDKPENCIFMLLLTMTEQTIRSIPRLDGMIIQDYFKEDGCNFTPGSLCICGHLIGWTCYVRNKNTDMLFSMGDCCIHKHKVLSEEEMEKMKTKLKKLKQQARQRTKLKKDFYACSECGELNVPKTETNELRKCSLCVDKLMSKLDMNLNRLKGSKLKDLPDGETLYIPYVCETKKGYIMLERDQRRAYYSGSSVPYAHIITNYGVHKKMLVSFKITKKRNKRCEYGFYAEVDCEQVSEVEMDLDRFVEAARQADLDCLNSDDEEEMAMGILMSSDEEGSEEVCRDNVCMLGEYCPWVERGADCLHCIRGDCFREYPSEKAHKRRMDWKEKNHL